MGPDLIVEHVGGLHLFSAASDRGREWLDTRSTTPGCQRLGSFLALEDERAARDLADAAVADGLEVAE